MPGRQLIPTFQFSLASSNCLLLSLSNVNGLRFRDCPKTLTFFQFQPDCLVFEQWEFTHRDSTSFANFDLIFVSMGVLRVCNISSTSCTIDSRRRFCSGSQNSSFQSRTFRPFKGNHQFSCCMAPTMPVTDVGESKDRLKGEDFILPHLRKLSPYQPILPFEVRTNFPPSSFICVAVTNEEEEVLSARLGRKPEDIIKLDANENPYGPPPEASCYSSSFVAEALGSLKFPYVYPDPESRRLRTALAEDSGLGSEYILAGCGADELIDLIMSIYRCVLEPGDKIVDCPPTFTMYEFDAAVNGALVIKVPRKSDFSLDLSCIIEVVEKEKPKCIFLTSPNNPDGSLINDADLLKILDLPILVVLDEAYIEFSGLDSKMAWVKKHENLIVLRTFSKRAGLAGLRVGYGAFPLSIIEYLWRAKQPYNVSVAAEVSACAALQNPTYLEEVKNALVQERNRLYKLLKEVPFLKPYPSFSNFILCEVTSGKDAKKVKEDLATMGVMIRHYDKKELKGYVRVSVGKPEHTNILMEGLKRLS
ncbi:hypothetical protein ACLOJK_033221 [Asimina triloba]